MRLDKKRMDEVRLQIFLVRFRVCKSTLHFSLWHHVCPLELQIRALEEKVKQEHETSKLQVSEVEKKLESVKQDLDVIKSSLQEKNAECVALQRNLQELEELREMKQVLIA